MDQGNVPVAFDILPASVRSGISAFQSLRRSDRLSIISLRRRLAGQDTEELVVTSRQEDQVAQVYKTAVGSEMQVATQHDEQVQMAPGIRWRYAEQGMNIQHIAYLEKGDSTFSRKSYIDGLAYMLMALPDNLSNQEAATIREALPPSIADTNLADCRNDRAIGWKPPPESRTVLQRFVANMVAIFVVLMHLALSYATIVVRVGAHYERKHNISQQIASRGFVIATAVGRHSVVLSTKICAMKDGRVGKAVSSLASWTAESVTYGIQEGIGQGLTMVDTKSRPS
ncbi:hypothetical protein F4801DRAFT_390827 [Xylaria longipes]|nr:hypothetical protein F4801DRAFT_390827 [Xylaria longipes]RYC63644.1 hypothetical protein CHU98_g2556 [Xylaria longipes]